MEGYELNIKLKDCPVEISRVITVPKILTFHELEYILKILFNFDYYHASVFNVPGLNTQLINSKGRYIEGFIDCSDILISDYFDLFRKISWKYDLSNPGEFDIKIKNIKKAHSYPEVKSFKGKYSPEEDFNDYFETFVYCMENNMELPEWFKENISYYDFDNFEDILTEFDINEVNKKLKDIYDKS